MESNHGYDFSEINSITKPPPPPHPQGLMANPEFSNILKNSLFSQVDNFDHNKHLHISSSCPLYQVNVSIGTAGVSSAGEMSRVRSLHVSKQIIVKIITFILKGRPSLHVVSWKPPLRFQYSNPQSSIIYLPVSGSYSSSQPCMNCEMIRSGDAMALGGDTQCDKCGRGDTSWPL